MAEVKRSGKHTRKASTKAKKRRKSKPSKIGLWWQKVSALPGEEPVVEQKPIPKPPRPRKPRINVKELKQAVDSINAAATSPKKRTLQSAEEREYAQEVRAEYSEALDRLQEYTKEWKKTGKVGVSLEPPETFKSRIDSFLDSVNKKRQKYEEKQWVSADKVPFRPNVVLAVQEKISKVKKQFKRDKRHVADIYSEVLERAESVDKQDKEIDHMVRQLED